MACNEVCEGSPLTQTVNIGQGVFYHPAGVGHRSGLSTAEIWAWRGREKEGVKESSRGDRFLLQEMITILTKNVFSNLL